MGGMPEINRNIERPEIINFSKFPKVKYHRKETRNIKKFCNKQYYPYNNYIESKFRVISKSPVDNDERHEKTRLEANLKQKVNPTAQNALFFQFLNLLSIILCT